MRPKKPLNDTIDITLTGLNDINNYSKYEA